MKKEKQYSFIDLFAGCGGLSEGFYRNNFNSLAHIEIDHFACQTLKTRMSYYGYKNPERAVLEDDITDELIIEKLERVIDGETIDVIIGGPPCQSFSPLGKAKDENNMQNDPRNYLFEIYIEMLNHFRPKIFVFENVTGLLKTVVNGHKIFDDIINKLSNNYKVINDKDTIILNASDYGVPQERKRVILIGVRKDLPINPEDIYASIIKTHCTLEESDTKQVGLSPNVTVQDAIKDLPKLKSGEGTKVSKYTIPYEECSDYARLMRKPGVVDLYDHVARKNNDMDVERYKAMSKNCWNFHELLENRPDLNHEKRRVFINSYKVQWWDRPSKTIIAHLYKDGNQFIHPDHNQARSITVREAARLQSFPDDFIVEGSRTEQYKQIGNAVPPVLAEAIAKAMKIHLMRLEEENEA